MTLDYRSASESNNKLNTIALILFVIGIIFSGYSLYKYKVDLPKICNTDINLRSPEHRNVKFKSCDGIISKKEKMIANYSLLTAIVFFTFPFLRIIYLLFFKKDKF